MIRLTIADITLFCAVLFKAGSLVCWLVGMGATVWLALAWFGVVSEPAEASLVVVILYSIFGWAISFISFLLFAVMSVELAERP